MEKVNIFDLVFPRRCLGCGKIGRYFCRKCSSIIRTIELNEAICPVCERPAIDGATHPRCRGRYTLDGLTSFFRYDGIVRKAVKTLKYRLVSDLTQEFISLIPPDLFNNLTIQQCNNCVLVPVPLHPTRFRERGFNQAEVLGKLMAQRLNLPVVADLLKRMKQTIPQVEMKKREDRLRNMEGVFAVNKQATQQFTNTAIILFDDVFTTGATMRSAAAVLKRAGARLVWAATTAR